MEITSAASLYSQISIPALPLLGTALLLLVTLPLGAVAGFLAGYFRRKKLLATSKKVDKVIGETTLSAVLALLGLLLAFSFGNALSLSQARKNTIVNEATALGTVFLRADYLSEPGRTKLQNSILDYTRTRLLPGDKQINNLEDAQIFLNRTLLAQAKLWPLTLEYTKDPTPVPIKTFVAGAMNDAIDAHLYRMEILSTPVSDVTQAMMLTAALSALFLLGNRAGMVGRTLTWRTFVFSGFLFVVMGIIIDMQRGNEGFIRTDDTALKVTIFDMKMTLADRQ
ncbi:MAG: hypothetical protein HRU33_10035 [Rhodobacteraceae bacterium]|nr:hypothetical protein [Paracoccaceae bacterium]